MGHPTLAYCAINEMESLAGQGNNNWLSNVNKNKNLLSIPNLPGHLSPNSAGNKITKLVKSHFDAFYLNQINKVSFSEDGLDHNKLRFYKSFKGSFTVEPYLELVHNRNQRAWLRRIRVSSHPVSYTHLTLPTKRIV